MSTEGLTVDEAIRAMLLLMPRFAARLKRTRIPARLQSMNLAPRHLSMLSYLVFDGPMTVNQLAARLEVAPTTVSLMVSDLSKHGAVDRRSDPADRRRTIVAITDDPETRTAINDWLANGAFAWQKAFEPLSPEDRAMFVRTIEAYEGNAASSAADNG
ncbi:MarR family winged helix-turn-helix transcriptional regulator [Kibdelosporangium aridum]|uniref:DNA-binding transcriptional regulator, MarR family n=1 Tax=Kibdelosporangium aridum TaxID=2030 RepID=A0A1Y5WSF4_KIBAR|nr:MarR family winged helix-turn-helix transcriptional regulator [Kibdelosporangium aridum]SMC48718.1 DNA-binding transcriptional regulator, MarR family [Kibdelosporangium aridum]